MVKQMFAGARGRLLDVEGVDWWDLISLLIAPEALEILMLQRLAREISSAAQLWSTRPGGPARMLSLLLEQEPQVFEGSRIARVAKRIGHYSEVVRNFSSAQIKEIVLDKYDSGYQWRRRFAARRERCTEPVVLIPSAYQNVSRVAAEYAQLLPRHKFLMVATRQSARRFVVPPNIEVQDLAAYVAAELPPNETVSLQECWQKVRSDLCSVSGMRALDAAGVLDPVPDWIRDGLIGRDAWRAVLERETVCGVLCGDDSNRYTALPVLLARKRNIPTVDFHHGAFDGRYLLKEMFCDLYLAKSEVERDYLVRVCGMPDERIVIGAPRAEESSSDRALFRDENGRSAIFLSEPYESAGMRAEEVYRDLLPPLCRLAREQGRDVIVKLHPFESIVQRRGLIHSILAVEDRNVVRIVDGPLTRDLLAPAWFGIAVESTAVMDCVRYGIPCFLCRWLMVTSYGYLDQFAKFGIGEMLESPTDLASIPQRLLDCRPYAAKAGLYKAVDPAMLQRWLTSPLSRGFSESACESPDRKANAS